MRRPTPLPGAVVRATGRPGALARLFGWWLWVLVALLAAGAWVYNQESAEQWELRMYCEGVYAGQLTDWRGVYDTRCDGPKRRS